MADVPRDCEYPACVCTYPNCKPRAERRDTAPRREVEPETKKE